MSDTPRTDAWKWSGGDDPMGEFYKFACQLERELNAANDRIKRLEEALEFVLCGAEKVQSKGYAFAQLDGGVVMARAVLAKAKEAKP